MWIQANATKQRLHKQQLHTKIKQISSHFIYYSLLLSYTASTHAILKLLTLNKILYTTSNVCKILVLLAVYAQFPLFQRVNSNNTQPLGEENYVMCLTVIALLFAGRLLFLAQLFNGYCSPFSLGPRLENKYTVEEFYSQIFFTLCQEKRILTDFVLNLHKTMQKFLIIVTILSLALLQSVESMFTLFSGTIEQRA